MLLVFPAANKPEPLLSDSRVLASRQNMAIDLL